MSDWRQAEGRDRAALSVELRQLEDAIAVEDARAAREAEDAVGALDDPVECARVLWRELRALAVADPALAVRLRDELCAILPPR